MAFGILRGVSYQVIARKYRPQRFSDVVGQEHVSQTLSNAISSGRIAHAYLFCGPRGTGKTTIARIFAKCLNCTAGPSVDFSDDDEKCIEIAEGRSLDVIEIDGASNNGVEQVRELRETCKFAPTSSSFKIYIIDEVHMLSTAAFNALLKTLEEPPAHVKFIFATTEIRQVPVTVLSRCQRFDLRRLTPEDTSVLLDKVSAAEDIKLNDEVTALIARAADGSARDALSLLDHAFAHAGDAGDALNAETVRGLLGLADRARVFDLFEMLMGGQLPEALAEFQAQYELGADPAVIIADLAELTHWITRLKYVPGADEDVSFSQSARARGRSAAEMLSTRVLSRAWQVLLKGHEETQAAFNTRAAAEMILIRLAHMADTPTPDELVRQYESAKPAPTPSASASPAPASSPPSAPTPSASSSSRGSASPVALGAAPEQAAAVSPASAASQPAAQIRLLESFEALLELVSEKRDLGLKHALEHGVHLVHFEAAQADKGGRLEIRLAGEQANIAQDLTRKLREWTGQNWMISLSAEAGAQTIASGRQTAADIRQEAAMADPLVKAALDVFPDARIEAITELDAPALSPADTDAGADTDIGGEDA